MNITEHTFFGMEENAFRDYMILVGGIDIAIQMEAMKAFSAEDEDSFTYKTDVNGIARFSVTGAISKNPSWMQAYFGGTSTVALEAAINKAAVDPLVKGAFVKMDTPGGNIMGLTSASAAIQAFAKKKPIYGFVDGLCASAGYWLGSQFCALYGDSSAIAGHIGVFTKIPDTSVAAKNQGVVIHLVKSSKYKGIGTPGVPVTDEAIANTQREVDAFHAMFEAAIVSGRRMKPEKVSAVSDGRGYIGQEAVSAGLMDGVMSEGEAYKKLLKVIQGGYKPSSLKGETEIMAENEEKTHSLLEKILAKLGGTPLEGTVVKDNQMVNFEGSAEYKALKAEAEANKAEAARLKDIVDKQAAEEAKLVKAAHDEKMEAYLAEGKFHAADLVKESELRAENPGMYDRFWAVRPVLDVYKTSRPTVDAKKIADKQARSDGQNLASTIGDMQDGLVRSRMGLAPKEDK